MTFRIALVGTNETMRTRLAELLRISGFAVENLASGTAAPLHDVPLDQYDAVIIDAGLVAQLEEDAVFTSLLNAKGFLIFENKRAMREVAPSFLIHGEMSPEDLIHRINTIVYQNIYERTSPRLRVKIPVEYEHTGKRLKSATQYISENGAFIITLSPPPDGTSITADFSLVPGGKHIVVQGHAVYSIGCNLDEAIISHPSSQSRKIVALPGFGFVFDVIADSDRGLIKDFVKKHH
jgi:hypothetical protein